jgi:hypothetical protein
MILIDIPRALLGVGVRVARVPVDLVFGRSSNGGPNVSMDPPPPPADRPPADPAERSPEAEELRRAINRAQEERKRAR